MFALFVTIQPISYSFRFVGFRRIQTVFNRIKVLLEMTLLKIKMQTYFYMLLQIIKIKHFLIFLGSTGTKQTKNEIKKLAGI